MQKAVITDHSFETPDIEKSILEPLGCSVVSRRAFTDQDADIVTLHCPSTEETRFMIAADSIAAMQDGALLINVSRGTLVDTAGLVAALRSGKLAGAALDVTDPEPIDPGHPLVGMENVLITSHVASVSEPSGRTLRTSVANTVAAAIRGEKLPNVVNGVGA